MQGQDYRVDASKLFSQVLIIFTESSKMCVVWCSHDGRQHLFYWSIITAFSESIASISLVIDSRDQLFYLVVAAHIGQFPSNFTRHCIFFGINPGFTIVCDVSSRFNHDFFRTLLSCYPLFIVQSYQTWLNFVSFQQWKFANGNLIH